MTQAAEAARTPGEADNAAAEQGPTPAATAQKLYRWLPLAAALATACVVLLISGTPVLDIARYAFYVVYSLLIPGTLVFRACRATPHTLIEDLAYGVVVGLGLELAAWAAFSAPGLQHYVIVWPLAVIIPFLAIPSLRKHWRPTGYTRVPPAWSWAVSLLVIAALWYLYAVYFIENPILPTSGSPRQYIDLSYQLSLAANAQHSFPVTLPQVAGQSLGYHWFAFVHMAMTGMVGGIDLSVVEMRLLIPGLTVLMLVVTSVTGWRLFHKAWVGPVAAALFFVIGEAGFAYPNALPFGDSPEVILLVWSSFSMTYSQPLLIALVGVLGDRMRHDGSPGPAPFGRRAWIVVTLLAFANSAAKASSLPVVLGALGVVALVALVRTRRIPWTLVGLGAVVAAGDLFATAFIFKFQAYGLRTVPLAPLSKYWAGEHGSTKFALAGVTAVAYLFFEQSRVAGLVPLLRHRRVRLTDREWFLLGGAVAGTGLYLCLTGFNGGYFMHAGLAFGIFPSAAGFVGVWERARMSRRASAGLALGGLFFAAALTWFIYYDAAGLTAHVRKAFGDADAKKSYDALVPILTLLAVLAALALVGAVAWRLGRGRVPGLRGRGALVLLTVALLAGAPTLPLDAVYSSHTGWFSRYPLPASQVAAARWLRDRTGPDVILATNEHCASYDDYAVPDEPCAIPNSFWLSAYSERTVLLEGWAFAPRMEASDNTTVFWDPALQKFNDDAIYHPTAAILAEMAAKYHVQYLVVDRKLHPESPDLAGLATSVYDNGRVAVYRLGGQGA